ncbi:ATP-binding cassette domain-containing protein, partial [bacterium]|nr:ATP-binding cassette domain-containing protein [bacterium]
MTTTTTSELAVQASGVWKVFNEGQPNEVTALQDIDLTVSPGEFVSLIGPSGCGKSTLLRVIADLTHATKGSVQVAGMPAAKAREEQRYGMAFQQAA